MENTDHRPFKIEQYSSEINKSIVYFKINIDKFYDTRFKPPLFKSQGQNLIQEAVINVSSNNNEIDVDNANFSNMTKKNNKPWKRNHLNGL